ncbi:MAG: S9 family peptidase, partial [Verrucomicrobia bacterium]|nr:S9 family peptidase [Verrucomicrobiota bacterium]
MKKIYLPLVALGFSALPFTVSHAAESPTIAPNEALVADGIPPIPAATAERAARYTDFRAATLLDWHPTRREVLIATRFGDTNQLHLVKTPGGARTQLTFYPDRVEGALFEPTRGEFLVFHKGTGGAEFFQNYRYDFATGETTLITDGKSRNSLPVFSRDGRRVAYTSTRRNGADTDLYVEDPLDPKSDKLLAEVQGGGWEPLDWSPDGKQLLVLEYVSIAESYLWLFDAQTGARTELTPRPAEGVEKVFYGKAQFTKDGKGIYVLTDNQSERQRLALVDLETKQGRYVSQETPFEIEDFDLNHDGDRLAFIANADGSSQLFIVDLAQGKMPVMVSLDAALRNAVISNLKWRRTGRELAFNVAGARSPSDIYTINADDRSLQIRGSVGNDEEHLLPVVNLKFTRWTESETGGLNPASFAPAQLVKWRSFDGREISGFLHEPDARKFPGKRPVIIAIHGGPEAQYRPGYLGRTNYFINELGCAVIFPNVRGSSGYGKTFVALDNGFKREDSYKDIDALLDWIKTQPALDAARIMVTGGSYGGHMTLAGAT